MLQLIVMVLTQFVQGHGATQLLDSTAVRIYRCTGFPNLCHEFMLAQLGCVHPASHRARISYWHIVHYHEWP